MAMQELAGYEVVAEQLIRHIRDRRVSHAYLFYGPRGTPKEQMAFSFAKAIHCLKQEGDACEQCENCRRIENGNHPDCQVLSPQGHSLRVEQVRQLQRDMSRKGVEAERKVYILQQADKLTTQAGNSLLKFLEEPVAEVVVILLAEQREQLLQTILSRCYAVPFWPSSPEAVVQTLCAEGIAPERARLAASLAYGVEEARELCQFTGFDEIQRLMIQWSEEVWMEPQRALLTLQVNVMRREEAIPLFFDLFLLWLRDLLNSHLQKPETFLFVDEAQQRERQASFWTIPGLMHTMDQVFQFQLRQKSPVQIQLALEGLFMKIMDFRQKGQRIPLSG